jgi:hypothetical protein
LQEESQTQLKSKVPTPPRRRLWFAICHVRALEPRQIRLGVEKSSRPRLKTKPLLAMYSLIQPDSTQATLPVSPNSSTAREVAACNPLAESRAGARGITEVLATRQLPGGISGVGTRFWKSVKPETQSESDCQLLVTVR